MLLLSEMGISIADGGSRVHKRPLLCRVSWEGTHLARRRHGRAAHAHPGSRLRRGQASAGQMRGTALQGKAEAILSECEQSRMFVRCSHLNVSTFSGRVSATGTLFSPNVSGVGAMFVRRRCDVLESLHLGSITASSPRPARSPFIRLMCC